MIRSYEDIVGPVSDDSVTGERKVFEKRTSKLRYHPLVLRTGVKKVTDGSSIEVERECV